jgi:hypothetical protein
LLAINPDLVTIIMKVDDLIVGAIMQPRALPPAVCRISISVNVLDRATTLRGASGDDFE